MKRISLIFAFCISMLVTWAHDFEVGGIYYNITSEEQMTVEVTYQGDSYSSYEYSRIVTIPETVNYNGNTYSVTSIGESAFNGCYDLISITIPASVTSIGYKAFYECVSLTSITLPDDVTEIGAYAFGSCDFRSITLPEGVTSIGNGVFYRCSSLRSITLPEGVTSIGGYAFFYCGNLESITLPESVTLIGDDAFRDCHNLTSINIPASVTNIGGATFCNCYRLTSVTIPENSQLTSIEGSAFYDCYRLTSINIPASVTSIGYAAFYGCESLTSITIPEIVTYIGGNAFDGTPWYKNQPNGVVYINDVLYKYKGTMPENTSIEVREGTVSIGAYAFEDCTSLTSITLPEGVTSIGEYAFKGCSSLTSITIPESVISIEYYAFEGCTGELTLNCNIPSSSFYDNAPFYGSKFTKVIIGESVTSIGMYAFYGCYDLISITLTEGVTNIEGKAFMGCCFTTITIPKSVTNIGESAFSHCSSLISVIFDENSKLTSISDDAFKNCSSLTAVTIPKSVTNIGYGAFRYCEALTSITLPEGVTNIEGNAFLECGLTTITIPKSVTNLGAGVFSGCNNLTEIMVAEGNTVYDSRNGCNAIIETSSNTLIAGRSTAVIPESVTSIGKSAFSNSTNLATITIPKSVTSIGYGAFRWSNILTSVTLPENVTEIEDYAFGGCPSLTSITCKAVTPPAINENTFSEENKSISLYVPAESVEAYKTAEYWSEFTNIQPIASELPSVVYLKNVGSGKFLTAANWWGTCASLGEHGLDMTLALLPNGKYTIDTQIKGSESNYFLGKIGEKLYMDATSTEWMIEDQGNGRYTLSLDGTYYMGFDGTSVVSENLTNSADANAQWQLLTREDLITEMKYATMASPVDATFYIRGANFSRQDLRNSAWIGEPSIGGEDENFCAEKRNSGVCTVYQELKDLPNGVYKLKTQGFYRMGGHNVAVNHRNEGTENYDVKFFANDASVPVMSVMDEAGKLSDVGVAYGNYGNAPSDRAHATQFFNKGYYQHEFYFTVTDGTAVVGIVNNSGLLDDWMCFDNFELYYCGEAAVILDSQTSYSQVEDKQYASITYTRNFKNANWQALYVPFEIPVTEEFLDDFEIAYINDVHQFDDDNNGDIDRTEVEAIKKVSGTLEANYPYLIRAKVAGEKQIVVTDAMLYAAEENSIDCSSVFNSYTFTGTYQKIPAVQLPKEEGYYAMSGGDWKQYSSGATSSLGAFRIYMKIDSRNENMKAQAHTIKMRVVGCDDEADDVTGIDDSQLTMDNSPLVIYDMQGRRITDMANLKGVYIVNGKKVVY